MSCRTSKYRLEEQIATRQVHRSESHEWQQYLQQDSTVRYWHFVSDSIFYFHPDTGLWALGGWLYAAEQSIHEKLLQSNISHRDSTALQAHAALKEQKVVRKKQLPWYVYLIVVLAVASLGIYYLWRKGF
ncbi:hypothetical protein [Sphingobacterium faecale]|uniref:Uncharacterized protein n=1 Tax=Sphingobacterium faecale TaxID=2803775 RepID=A0ABS1R6Q5_9SPHI|nr:hypothetical protein [Sphingobacterium faecale]MBL1410386.1 hypothetical protein [Sphingobacterium faecale]